MEQAGVVAVEVPSVERLHDDLFLNAPRRAWGLGPGELATRSVVDQVAFGDESGPQGDGWPREGAGALRRMAQALAADEDRFRRSLASTSRGLRVGAYLGDDRSAHGYVWRDRTRVGGSASVACGAAIGDWSRPRTGRRVDSAAGTFRTRSGRSSSPPCAPRRPRAQAVGPP